MSEVGGLNNKAIPYERTNGGGDPELGPVEFVNVRDGWLAAAPKRLFRTTDGGQTWTESDVP